MQNSRRKAWTIWNPIVLMVIPSLLVSPKYEGHRIATSRMGSKEKIDNIHSGRSACKRLNLLKTLPMMVFWLARCVFKAYQNGSGRASLRLWTSGSKRNKDNPKSPQRNIRTRNWTLKNSSPFNQTKAATMIGRNG